MECDLPESIENFLAHLATFRHASPHTLRNYRIDCDALQEFCDSKELTLKTLDRKGIREYISQLSQKGLSKRSIQRKISSARSFFNYLVLHHVLSHNPTDLIEPMKQTQPIPKALNSEEVARFFELPDTSSYLGLRDRVIFELFYSSGLRVAELHRLDIHHIDFSSRLLRIHGKGSKVRIVPVTQSCREWLIRYLNDPRRHLQTSEHDAAKDTQACFLNRFGQRLSTRSIDRLFSQYLQKLNLPVHITPHVLRHTIATHWLEKGMNLKIIQELLGHASPATTQIYTKVSKRYKQEGYAEAHPLMKKEEGH